MAGLHRTSVLTVDLADLAGRIDLTGLVGLIGLTARLGQRGYFIDLIGVGLIHLIGSRAVVAESFVLLGEGHRMSGLILH